MIDQRGRVMKEGVEVVQVEVLSTGHVYFTMDGITRSSKIAPAAITAQGTKLSQHHVLPCSQECWMDLSLRSVPPVVCLTRFALALIARFIGIRRPCPDGSCEYNHTLTSSTRIAMT